MPSRLVCVAILLYWLVAAVGLISRDLLPELSLGSPPDLRTISSAGGDAAPARWIIQVVDNPHEPEAKRSVGQILPPSSHQPITPAPRHPPRTTPPSGEAANI